MRLMVGRRDGRQSVYRVDGDLAVDLTAADSRFTGDLQTLIDLGPEGMRLIERASASGNAIPLHDVAPALPISDPAKIICLGLNYVDHAKEGGYEVPTYPAMFMRVSTSLLPSGAAMIRPRGTDTLDYEAELMVIVGTGGRRIPETDALDHVFGYTTFNDVSVREYQRKSHQWTPGKNFDGTGVVGPVVVTSDELPPGATGLKIESRLNGNVMQSASTGDMMWPVAKTVAAISEFLTLEPGDMIAMGTPPGVGHARRPPVFMKHGDIIEVEIEKIGLCRNQVVDESGSAAFEAA